ncbi:hypothetical protein C8J57DRAFT_1275415 [Mycena rebaudengoi]|nr:hypothetical protein C8J57DRAFT_1275415 [Mycena rebaudengoi]
MDADPLELLGSDDPPDKIVEDCALMEGMEADEKGRDNDAEPGMTDETIRDEGPGTIADDVIEALDTIEATVGFMPLLAAGAIEDGLATALLGFTMGATDDTSLLDVAAMLLLLGVGNVTLLDVLTTLMILVAGVDKGLTTLLIVLIGGRALLVGVVVGGLDGGGGFPPGRFGAEPDFPPVPLLVPLASNSATGAADESRARARVT